MKLKILFYRISTFNNKVSNFINYDNRILKVHERLSHNAIDLSDILSDLIDINQSQLQ